MIKLNERDKRDFENTYKVGLVGTADDEGDPHVSLLSSLMAKDESTMIAGEFIKGLSKKFMRERPKCGFLIMGLDKSFWLGKMTWLRSLTEGEDYVRYNQFPLYRYNTYCGIDTVHYFSADEMTDRRALDMGKTVASALRVSVGKRAFKTGYGHSALKPWAVKLCSVLTNLKFLCYIGGDGYPALIPAISAQACCPNRIVIAESPYPELFAAVGEGARVAVFVMNLDMESALVKGTYHRKKGMAYVDIDRVYNSMPPKHGYIYPACPNRAVEFNGELN